MSLLWIDGFDAYGDTAGDDCSSGILHRYPDSSADIPARVGAGRYDSGFCLYAQSNPVYYVVTPTLPYSGDTIITGFALRRPGSYTSDPRVVQLCAGTTVNIAITWLYPEMELAVYRGATTAENLLGTTSGAGLGSTWKYIEIKVKISDTVGTVDVYVDGVSVLSVADADTKPSTPAYCDRVRLYPSAYSYFDDWYVVDTAGSINNNVLGPQKVVTIFPSGDSSVAWTPSTGTTHYDLLDERATGATDETDWVETNASGTVDVYTYADVSSLNSIAGIQLSTVARNYDGSTLKLVTRVVSDEATSDSGDVTLTSAMREYTRVLEVDPATSTAWTVSGVNAATFGIKSN
jgi:hypothetical protein